MKQRIQMPDTARFVIKLIIALVALTENVLTMLSWDYLAEYPLSRIVFAIFENVDGWGMESVFATVGLGAVFYAVRERERQRKGWVSVSALFFSLCTVFGKSYLETGSWDYAFRGKFQFLMAALVLAGYYFVYKNVMLFLGLILEKKPELLRSDGKGKFEAWIFGEQPFWGPFIVLIICGLPWLLCYWPGTLQWDAHAQLWQYLGVQELTGHHPVISTKLMGGCMTLGRMLFNSDEVGIFLYTGPQFVAQCLIFAYGIWLATRMRVPMICRWGMLLFYGVYPLLPIWGFTEVKDTGYYLLILLFVLVLADVMWRNMEKPRPYQWVLWILATVGIGLFRNDGRYVVLGTLLIAFIVKRKFWKLYLIGAVACLAMVIAVEDIYMPVADIQEGSVREAISVPMLQTARYLAEHGGEVTGEELAVLQNIFGEDLSKVVESYSPENADGVKELFAKYFTSEELSAYFKVWWQQLWKHPDTYIQAFLNHTYGYLYPERRNVAGSIWNFEIGNKDHWQDGYLDIAFGMKNDAGRNFLETYAQWVYRMPVIGIFMGTGIYNFILFGCVAYLWSRKKEYIILLLPCVFTLGICMMAPIGACVRYMLPNIVIMPFALAWCGAVKVKGYLWEENENGSTNENGESEREVLISA